MYSDLASRSSRDVVVISPAATGDDKVKKETLKTRCFRVVHKWALFLGSLAAPELSGAFPSKPSLGLRS